MGSTKSLIGSHRHYCWCVMLFALQFIVSHVQSSLTLDEDTVCSLLMVENRAALCNEPSFKLRQIDNACMRCRMLLIHSALQEPTFVNDRKAILFIFSQPWCGACTKLKASFMEEGEKLLDISKDFLLINVGGDDNNKFGVTTSSYRNDTAYPHSLGNSLFHP